MLLDPAQIIQSAGLIGIFLIILIESGVFFGFFLPGDTLLFSAGIFAQAGVFPLHELIVACAVAAIIGGHFGYYTGRKIGPKLFTREDSLLFKKKYVHKAHAFYMKYGAITVLISRFVPIARTFSPIVAGIGEMPRKTFHTFNILGGIIWPLVAVLVGYYIGGKIPYIEYYLVPIMITVALLSITPILIPFACKMCKKN